MGLASGRLSRRLLPCWLAVAAEDDACFGSLAEAPVPVAFCFGASSLLATGALREVPAQAADLNQ